MNSVVSEKKFIQERLGIPYENLSQSYLRAETQLSNLSTYNFYLQRGQVAAPLVTEQLLELNDQFVITHFRISLRYIDPSTTAAPTAQSTNLTTAGTTGTPAATFTGNTGGVNGYDNGLFGFYVSEPTLIDGRQTLDISLNLGASVTIAAIGTDPMIYATLETRGYLVVNSKS